MKPARSIPYALALLLAGLPAAAQRDQEQERRDQQERQDQQRREREQQERRDQERRDQQGGGDQERRDQAGREQERSGETPTQQAPTLEFGVAGLTPENAEQIRTSLRELRTQVYVCSGCEREYARAGTCETCKLTLRADERPVFQEATPAVERSSVRVRVAPGRTLRYSDLERALLANSIRIEGSKFPLDTPATLVLRGGSQENVAEVERALNESGAFERAETRFEPSTGEIQVTVRPGRNAPSLSQLSSTLKSSGSKLLLADVIWGEPALKS